MRTLLGAEWRRLRADRASLWVLALLAAVLLASGISSALDARNWRAHVAQLERQSQDRMAARIAQSRQPSADPLKAARRTFDIARADAPVAVLPALGGLGLGSRAFSVLTPAVRVTVESRHTDTRREERLPNPQLQGFSMPDFATVVALLVPLALIALCAGAVQHAREQNLWRPTIVQCPRIGAWMAATLALRGGAVWVIAALASCVAVLPDPGGTAAALAHWLLALAAFVAFWTAASALTGMLRISSSSAVLLAVGVWLLTTFVIPAALAWRLDGQMPMPSRLAVLVQIRDAQQRAEADADALMARWYDAHPEARASVPATHTWPVSFMPRYLAQEQEVGPLMAAFDDTRASRYAWLRHRAWLSPSLSMAMLADELAGIDAPRHARFMAAVSRYEGEWRAFFVDRIMRYRDIGPEELARAPRFAGALELAEPPWRYALGLLALALASGWAVMLLRRRLDAG